MSTDDITVPPIDSFRGKHNFLSNFYYIKVRMDGEVYDTLEAAYQAAKSDDLIYRRQIRLAKSPAMAKRLGRRAALRENWDAIRLGIMEGLLRSKFSHHALRKRLVRTYPAELIEGNTWNDTFWGVCNGVGENYLGRLLMKLREEFIRADRDKETKRTSRRLLAIKSHDPIDPEKTEALVNSIAEEMAGGDDEPH